METYTTLNNILINNSIPFYASIDLTNLTEAQAQRTIFQAAYDNSDGSMIFDLCFVNWDMIKAAIEDTEYVNTSVIGVYNPTTKEILYVDNLNTARAEDKLTLYTSEYGTSTGTNQWGVEVVVDHSGKVVELKNQMQAADWNWATPQNNDSNIPEGGFVLSTVDRSGYRVYRQLLANSFHVGDKVAAAVLSEYLDNEEKIFTGSKAEIEVKVTTYGQNQKVKVLIGGKNASAKKDDYYSAKVKVTNGSNVIPIVVYVDGLKVLEKNITVESKVTNYETYIVQLGDTLWSIAKEFNTTIGKLLIDNLLKNPKGIFIGQVLKIIK